MDPTTHVHSHGGEGSCACVLHSGGAAQTLDEMEFERGIWSAAMDGDEGKVRRLLGSGTGPDATDSAGYTPLHYASRSGHTHICRLLLTSGASANARTPGGRATPLHRAAYRGHVDVVRLLLEHGADVGVVDSDGMSALHKAAEGGHYLVAEVLVRSSSSTQSLVSAVDHRNRTPRDLVRELYSKWEGLLSVRRPCSYTITDS